MPMDQFLPPWARRWISSTTDKPLDRGDYELVDTATSTSIQNVEKEREPTEAERRTLRKIADNLPWCVQN